MHLRRSLHRRFIDFAFPRYTLKAHAGSVNALDMNEHFLVSGSVCGSAKVWDVRDGSYVTSLLKGGSRVNAIRIVGKRHIFVGCEVVITFLYLFLMDCPQCKWHVQSMPGLPFYGFLVLHEA